MLQDFSNRTAICFDATLLFGLVHEKKIKEKKRKEKKKEESATCELRKYWVFDAIPFHRELWFLVGLSLGNYYVEECVHGVVVCFITSYFIFVLSVYNRDNG